MDIWKFFDVGHENHVFYNPMSEAKFDEFVERLALPENARVLDIACGQAPLMIRVARRWGSRGVGVDLSPPFVVRAREAVAEAGLSDEIEIIEKNGAEYDAEPASFDATFCIGASWIFGGHGGTLEAMAAATKPGGLVAVGEPFWIKDPEDEYLRATGLTRDGFATHAGNVQAGLDRGLRFLYTVVSNEDDWDRYEGLQFDAGERYAIANPEDPDVPGILKLMNSRREEYLRWGRDTLGWALYLFMKEPATGG